MSTLKGKRIGIALTGSFCTFDIVLDCMRELVNQGAVITAILSYATNETDTRFGKAQDLKEELSRITNLPIIHTITQAEPIGPGRLFDALAVLPATGNTIAKIATGIADTPVTMAVKSHLRNNGAVILGISSNDALSTGAKNIGQLLNTRNIYFVPFGQDFPTEKPRSLVFKSEYVVKAIEEALVGCQVQPILV